MSVLKNSAWNVLGVVIPTLFAVPSLGIYSRALGVELLGLLTMTFAIVGYASSFDFGLCRALIRQVSIYSESAATIKKLMGTTTVFVSFISLFLVILTLGGSSWLAAYLNISTGHRYDAITSFYFLSLSIPPYLLSQVGTAYFEGLQDFKTLNYFRCVSSALNAIAGITFVYFVPTLTSVIMALCISRWISCAAILVMYRRNVNILDRSKNPALLSFDRAILLSSLSYGGWLTVSNVIGPIMSYFDRFVLSHLGGAKIVAYYTVPVEIVMRLLLFPAAISKSLFPRLSKRGHDAASDRKTGFFLTLVCAATTIVPVYIFSGDLLHLWMGADYGKESATVLRILLVGLFFNSLSLGPFTDLQARGHSRATAFIHLIEVLPYLLLLYFLTSKFGIVGTAFAWTIRTVVDFLLMQSAAWRLA